MTRLQAILAVVASFALASARANVLKGCVVKVSDGDTITVLDSSKTKHKIRLEKIDAPEKSQAFGEVSRKYLASIVAGKDVDVEWKKRDKYGRILGNVFVDDVSPTGDPCRRDVNLSMVQAGMAWHYRQFGVYKAFSDAEADAKKSKLGLWRDPNPVPPHEFRKKKKKGTKK